jgi:hypothetical protein
MEYEEFIEVVGQASGGLSAEMAELHPWIHTGTEPEKFDLGEFLDRVAKREDTDTNHR